MEDRVTVNKSGCWEKEPLVTRALIWFDDTWQVLRIKDSREFSSMDLREESDEIPLRKGDGAFRIELTNSVGWLKRRLV